MPAMPATTATSSAPPPPPPLLRLPPSIRRRIYLYLDLESWGGYQYTVDLSRKTAQLKSPSSDSVRGLLLCCRTIYTEAAALLYSANRFIIYYSKPGSLAPLHALTPSSIARLTSLKVILNEAACHEPNEDDDARWKCCRYGPDNSVGYRCEKDHAGAHSRPLISGASPDNGADVPAAQTLSNEWHVAADYLSSHLNPGRLELSVVCDIDHRPEDAHEIAKSVVAPFQFLPRLRNCHVRLCDVPDPRLQWLAQDAALQARRVATPYYKPSTTQAAFVTLPRELRLRILEYTDLVTPWKEVSWSRLKPAYSILGGWCSESKYSSCRFPDHSGCQFLRCSITLNHGCFCRRHHSAFSSACRCWSPPGPALFLICRTLCMDAQLVFFSGNRFIVHDYHSDILSVPPLAPGPPPEPGPGDAAIGYYPWERFSVSIFLRDVVPRLCLSYLRFIEVVFPPYCHDHWPKPGHPVMEDWCATVDWLRDKINAPGLTIWLIMDDEDEYPPSKVRGSLENRQGAAIVKAYGHIMSPLRRLAAKDDGLGRFYAQLGCIESWTRDGYEQMMSQPSWWVWYESREREKNERGERYVMGDRYDAQYAGGNEGPVKSIWQFPPDPYTD